MAEIYPMELGIVKKNLPPKFFIAGLDEVGRGPLAGPVVAGCVFLKWENFSRIKLIKLLNSLIDLGVTDSKKVSPAGRDKVLRYFRLEQDKLLPFKYYQLLVIDNVELGFSLHEMGPDQIDKINILNASLESMASAFKKCRNENILGEVLVDGNRLPKDLGNNLNARAIIEGDSKSLLIGLASILAKEYRDHLMKKMDKIYPQYNFIKNMGYPTHAHKLALKNYGITPIHRKSFKGVKEIFLSKSVH